VLDEFCQQQAIKFFAFNIDYRHFPELVKQLMDLFYKLEAEGNTVLFMGSSLGGFTREYMAMKLQAKAIMINPATQPSELLKKYIDNVSENFETQQSI